MLGDCAGSPAGLVVKSFDETAAKNLQPDIYYPTNRVTNTVKEKKNVHVPDIVHGVPTRKSESVARTFKASQTTPLNRVINEVKEQIYASNKNEPLGRSRIYGYELPPTGYIFGTQPRNESSSIAESLNPPDACSIESEEVRAMYRKTHQDYEAGEQRKRGYTLPRLITESDEFRYGKESRRVQGSVKQCFEWSLE